MAMITIQINSQKGRNPTRVRYLHTVNVDGQIRWSLIPRINGFRRAGRGEKRQNRDVEPKPTQNNLHGDSLILPNNYNQ